MKTSSHVQEEIEGRRDESIRMVEEITWTVGRLHEEGVRPETAFEWPRDAGWEREEVKAMIEKCGLEIDCRFDGCRYGLRECGAR
eukprot:15825194-Heterocapsa_arctica.AAC.1